MKIINYVIFLLPFIVAFIAALFVSAHGPVFILSYFVLLGLFVSAFVLADFLILYSRSKKNTEQVPCKEVPNLRIAVLITTFNEDIKLVLDTILSAKLAVGKKGDVFVLDDSTSKETRKQIEQLKDHGFNIIQRNSRRGYKAGAINDWLKANSNNYDLMAIFDADQRPMPYIFAKVAPYFNDKKIAFVQIPQYYSDISSGISLGAFYQQLPFLRLIMNGRNRANSAFSLGSGTIYRIKALLEIGGLDESTVTEDISTALDLHSRGWKSAYIDKPLIWYGIPPKTIAGYWVQQGRWSLGGFQILTKILSAKLSPSQFFDYYNGWLYWLTVGPITLFELIAPVIFLMFGVAFLNWNPIAYLSVYIPYFISSLLIYLFITRKHNYGIQGFVYHHTVQLLAFISVTSSFAAWLMRKRRPFAVTPKGDDNKTPPKILFSFSAITILLALSAIKGIIETVTTLTPSLVAYAINIFWALYFTSFFIFGLYIIMRKKPYSEKLKLNLKPMYLSATEKSDSLLLAVESVQIEEKISEIYISLSKKLKEEDSAILKECSIDSAVHAKILRQILEWLDVTELPTDEKQTPITDYIGSLQDLVPLIDEGLDKEKTLNLLQLLLEAEREFSEEVYIGLISKIFEESLLKNTKKYEETKRMLQRIKRDEEKHVKLIKQLRDKYI